MGNSLHACEPCDCTLYGGYKAYNITRKPIQQWLANANLAGKNHGMNPACFLAISVLETEGDASKSGGIVQVGSVMLDAYNAWKGTSYTRDDLNGTGKLVKTENEAVDLSFDILGRFLAVMNQRTYSFALSATAWNGCYCGASGSVRPFDDVAVHSCPVPTHPTCYGANAFELAEAYDGWWINPETGKPDSFYFGELEEVPYDTLSLYKDVCNGFINTTK